MNSKTTRMAIVALILVVVSGGVFGLVVYKVLAEGDKLEAQISVLEKEKAREESYFRLQRLAEDTVDDRKQLASYFLERESNSIDFLNRIEALAPQMNVTLKTNGLELLVDKGTDSVWVEASFTFGGTRTQVENFIKMLENLPYTLRVNEVDLMARSSDSWNADVILQVKVLTYDK